MRVGGHRFFRLATYRWGFYCFVGWDYSGIKFGVRGLRGPVQFGNRKRHWYGLSVHLRAKKKGCPPRAPHAITVRVMVG